MSFAALARNVRAHLAAEHRFAHSVRVARLADRLAQSHAEDPGLARVAGLVHDLARLYAPHRLVAECEARGLTIDAFERRNPLVLHARLGAELARERFGIGDAAVLSAVSKHTVASPTMSRLDCIVYLADALEPGRVFVERAGLEALAFRDLERAMPPVLYSTVTYLRKRNLEVAPQTLAALAAFEALERSPLSA